MLVKIIIEAEYEFPLTEEELTELRLEVGAAVGNGGVLNTFQQDVVSWDVETAVRS